MGLYKADFISGGSGTAVACPLGKLVADGGVSMSILPYDFYKGCTVVWNGEIHIIGSSESSYYKYHFKYNGSSWVSVSTLPYNFYYGCAVVYNDEIHIMGGTNTNATMHYIISRILYKQIYNS